MAFEFEILGFLSTDPHPGAYRNHESGIKARGYGIDLDYSCSNPAHDYKDTQAGDLVTIALALDVLTCNVILKPLIARTRPYDINTAIDLLIAAPKDFSFPSGHTASSFAAAAALWFGGKKKLAVPALALAVLIAFSRMYFYVHYPTDVLCGAILGMLCGYMAYKLLGNRMGARLRRIRAWRLMIFATSSAVSFLPFSSHFRKVFSRPPA